MIVLLHFSFCFFGFTNNSSFCSLDRGKGFCHFVLISTKHLEKFVCNMLVIPLRQYYQCDEFLFERAFFNRILTYGKFRET